MQWKKYHGILWLIIAALFVTTVVAPATSVAAEKIAAYNKLRAAKFIVTKYIKNNKGPVTIKDLLTVTNDALFKSSVTISENLFVDGSADVMNIDFGNGDISALDTASLTGGTAYYNVADTKLYLWTGTAWVDLSQTSTLGDTIESSEVTDDTIAVADIASNAVTTTKILDSTIASADIAADTIVAADIATDAVTTTEILDGTVSSADIATDTIVAGDIATDAVTTAELLDSTIVSSDIAADVIVAADIATDAVTTTEILDGTIVTADIASETITGTQILDENVTASDIFNITRTISFPLRSFIECQTDAGADIGFDSTSDTLPDFVNSPSDGTGFLIRFDASSGTEDQNSEICNNFTVPTDYASGGLFKIRILKSGSTVTNSEIINCAVSVNGGALQTAGTATITSASSTTVTCTPTIASLTFYDTVSFTLYVTSSGTMDDSVDIAGVAFAYSATQ